MANGSKDPLDNLTWSLKTEANQTPRAPRVATGNFLRFRSAGQSEWTQGVTFDVSPTGVLFRANKVLEVHAIVQLNFVLPFEIAGKDGAEVFCRGQIVRTIMPATNDGQPHMAAKILDYLPETRLKPDLGQGPCVDQPAKLED
jgi:hypothetical protein